MASKSVLKRGFPTKAENLAIHYRDCLGLSKFKPLDAFQLANFLDVPIYTVDEIFGGEGSAIFKHKLNTAGKFDAMWMPNDIGEKLIIYNSNNTLYRQQSNLMHELAHIILEHEVPEEISKICCLYNLHYYNKEQEQEAKYLGACLQIAKPGLMWALKEDWSTERISEFYTASSEMVTYRLNMSGAKKQSYYAKMKTR